jgi:Rieske Fe-S protein
MNELAVGSSKLFRDPKTDAPCILIRLSEELYVAYSQSCTHLMCPVHFDGKKNQLICPCHEGFFNAEDGRVLAGPPPRSLPRFPVEIRDGQIWVRMNPKPA